MASRQSCIGSAVALLVVTACSFNWDAYDPRLGADDDGTVAPTGGSGAGAGTSGGAGPVGGAGGQLESGGEGGAGGDGGVAGGPPGVLVDRGLLTRYYLDEASSGQQPMVVVDHAAEPLNLPITWTPGMSYASVEGHRGLSWTAIELDGRASQAIDGTKIQGLETLQEATIEVVVKVDAVSASNSRLSHIGTDSDAGRLTLSTGNVGELRFYWGPGGGTTGSVLAGHWPVNFNLLGRVVLHLVLDVTRQNASDRARLFVDGVLIAPNGGTPPNLDAAIDLVATNHYVLGNREIGQRSFVGQLYYSALYTAALTDDDVQNNAAVLLYSDDTP